MGIAASFQNPRLACFALVSCTCIGQVTTPDGAAVESVAKEIAGALARRDRSAMEQRIANPFTLMHPAGPLMTEASLWIVSPAEEFAHRQIARRSTMSRSTCTDRRPCGLTYLFLQRDLRLDFQ